MATLRIRTGETTINPNPLPATSNPHRLGLLSEANDCGLTTLGGLNYRIRVFARVRRLRDCILATPGIFRGGHGPLATFDILRGGRVLLATCGGLLGCLGITNQLGLLCSDIDITNRLSSLFSGRSITNRSGSLCSGLVGVANRSGGF